MDSSNCALWITLIAPNPLPPPASLPRTPGADPRFFRTRLLGFRAIAANISELFRSLEKPPLPALPFFVGC